MPAKKKPAKKAAKAKAAKFPFPFFGQGDAEYYEWFEMWVWFASAVPKAKRAALVKMAPALCRLDAQWPAAELLWPSTGDQWIQQHLVAEYGTAAAKKKMKAATAKQEEDPYGGDDDDLDDLLAMGGESKQFNADIEKWLLALHAKQPILFAARREDGEAGGTRLGAWHKASLGMYAAIEPTLEAAAKKLKQDDHRKSAISIVVNYVGDTKVKPSIKKLVQKDEG
jgi:hypothetical protein